MIASRYSFSFPDSIGNPSENSIPLLLGDYRFLDESGSRIYRRAFPVQENLMMSPDNLAPVCLTVKRAK